MPTTKPVVVRAIPIALWTQLKIRALQQNQTVTDALIQAIQHYLNEKAA